MINNHIPGPPPDPFPTPTNPIEPSAHEYKLPSIELQGERVTVSFDAAGTSAEKVALGQSYRDEDARGWPKKLSDASENGWSEGKKRAHPSGLQMSWAAKRLHKTSSVTTTEALRMAGSGETTQQTRRAEIHGQETQRTSRGR